MLNVIDIKNASTSELVEFFNANASVIGANPVKRFSDRKSAEARVAKIVAALPVETVAEPNAETFPVLPANATVETLLLPLLSDSPAPTPSAAPTAPKTRTASEGIADSWRRPEVAAARLKKDNVTVDTGNGPIEYRSVRSAFKALGLDDKKHIRFRLALKETGKKEYREGGKGYKFVII